MKQVLVFVWIVALTAVTGCGDSGSGDKGGSGGNGPFRIAVIPKGTLHEFWKSVEAGARNADAEFDDVTVTWKGPVSEGNSDQQIEITEGFIADGYDGICLAPSDAVAMRKPVDQALEYDVPVVVLDSALADDRGIVSYVATNNYRGGQLAGRYLAELLGQQGKVIIMLYQINSESTEQRERGFLETMAEYPNIELLSQNEYGGPGEDKAIDVGENLLSNFGDEVDGIFCPNESTASGMLTALRRDPRGLAGKVKFVGFDASDNLVDGLKSGHLHGTILQDPVQIGYESVRVMRDHLLGKSDLPERLETREHLARFDALDDPVTVQLLYPEAVE